jgi:uncharacterized protein YwgA
MNKESTDFLVFLHNNKLINLANIQDHNHNGFNSRLRLQKLVFIAQSRFNLPEKYFYSLYKHGPYSPKLTDDSYELDLTSLEEFQEEMDRYNDSYSLPSGFNQDKFVTLLLDKNNDWLEIASTLIEIKDNTDDIEKSSLIEIVSNYKPNYAIQYIEKVFEQLSREKLILTIIEEMDDVVNKNPDIFEALEKEDITLIK